MAFSRDIVVGTKEVVEEIGLEEEGGRKSGRGGAFVWLLLGRERDHRERGDHRETGVS